MFHIYYKKISMYVKLYENYNIAAIILGYHVSHSLVNITRYAYIIHNVIYFLPDKQFKLLLYLVTFNLQ